MNNTSIISREESASIKGFAILLIVLGHIGREFSDLQYWLYSYHLILFFMLPFLYGKKDVSPTKIFNTGLRMYGPYLWCLILCASIAMAIGYTHIHTPLEYLKAFITGSQTLLKGTYGFNFPWFMPAFFFLSLFLFIKDSHKKWAKPLTALIFLYGLFIIYYLAATSPSNVYKLSCISRGAAYFFIGYITSLFIFRYKTRLHTPSYRYSILFIFIISVIAQALLQKYYTILSEDISPFYTPLYLITEITAPFSALCLLYSFRKNIAQQKFLISIGNLSFEIYCFHVIILNCLWKAFDILGISSTPITALAIFFLTCIISIGVATGIRRIGILHKLLFPRGLKR